MIRYYNFPQRSPQWYTYKKDKWSGSTAIDLLKGKNTPPEVDSDYDNKYMQRGRILEKLAIEEYERKTGNKISHFGGISNSKYKHAWFSPDGVEPDTIDEVKCFNVEKHMAIGTGKIPIPKEIIAQGHFGIVISELHKIVLILYNPDAEIPLFILDIPVQQSILDNIIKRLKETEPKTKPSHLRAQRRYIKNNPLKVKESQHKRYIRNREKQA